MGRRIGIVGYGHLGKYLVNCILQRKDLELAFVWNRSLPVLESEIESKFILKDLSHFDTRKADLIVEVCHPVISEKYGCQFIEEADYMIGSPTALSAVQLECQLRKVATKHGLYIPTGAFWGAEDIKKMADRGTLQALKVTMKKHPSSFKLEGELFLANQRVTDKAVVLYDGPVRGLCCLAPNNVNTMAAAAMAAHSLGFDGVKGSLVSDPNLLNAHVVEIDVWGPGNMEDGTAFHCKTVRMNPAQVGNVTGTATYASFLSSMLAAVASHDRGPGVHLC